MPARIVVDERALRRALAQDGVRAEVRARAEAVAERARATAPVITGRYRASIHVEEDEVDGVPAARVVAGAPYSVYVEAADGTLGNALADSAVRAERP